MSDPKVPTFSTLTDIASLGVQFTNSCNASNSLAIDNMNRANTFIRIQDPAFPDDPTKRIWHNDMLVFYSTEELVFIMDLYIETQRQFNFWQDWVGINCNGPKMQLFNVLPKLDALVGASMVGIITG